MYSKYVFKVCISLTLKSGDDTLKLWDLRNFKTPVSVVDNLPNIYSMFEVAKIIFH